MEEVLNNAVWHALNSGNSHLAKGTGDVKYFDVEVSPFVAFRQINEQSFLQLHKLISNNRICLLATPVTVNIPANWEIVALVHGVQMVHNGAPVSQRELHE